MNSPNSRAERVDRRLACAATEKSQTMLDIRRDPQESLGVISPGGVATIEKIAINAVIAGCLQYLPVVITAVEAMLDPVSN